MAIAVALYSTTALAQSDPRDLDFIGSGSWNSATNWEYYDWQSGETHNAVPRAQDAARIANNRSASISSPAAAVTHLAIENSNLTINGSGSLAAGNAVNLWALDTAPVRSSRLAMYNGATLTTEWLVAVADENANITLIIDGDGTALTTEYFVLGTSYNTAGEVNVELSADATMTVTEDTEIGGRHGVTEFIIKDSQLGDSKLTVGGKLYVGDRSSSNDTNSENRLSLQSGGKAEITGDIEIQGGRTTDIEVNGANSKLTGRGNLLFGNFDYDAVGEKTLKLTNGGNVTILGGIAMNGGSVAYAGTGTHSANIIVGSGSTLEADAIAVGTWLSAPTLPAPDSFLRGTGTVKLTGTGGYTPQFGYGGAVTVFNMGVLAAGNVSGEIGTLTIDGALGMANDSTLEVSLDSGNQASKIAVTGRAELETINVNLLALTDGTYDILSSGGVLTYNNDAALLHNGTPISNWLAPDEYSLEQVGNRLELVLGSSGGGPDPPDPPSGHTKRNVTLSNGNANWNTEEIGDGEFNQRDAVEFSGTGNNTVTVTAPLVQVADLSVTGGTWTFDSGNIAGLKDQIVDGTPSAGGLIVANGTSATFNGNTNFEGNLTASGNVTLNGNANSFAGVVINNTATVTGNIGNNANLTFGGNGTYDADGESRSLATLNGANGTVAMGANNLSVQSGNFGGAITGTGGVTKTSNGTLILNGVNTYTGTTTVGAGSLIVGNAAGSSASIFGDVNVSGGATLGGHGHIGGQLVLKNGATLSPGTSIGQLEVEGGAVFESGSTYLYEIDKTGETNDTLVVSGGSVVIEEGAHLDIVFLNGNGRENDEFQVIASGPDVGVEGEFTLNDYWTRRFYQDLRLDGLYIVWQFTDPEFAINVRPYATRNAYNAAVAMDTIYDLGRQDRIAPLYDALADMDASDPRALAAAFAQLHGEVFASGKVAAARMQRQFVNLLPSASAGITFAQREYRGQCGTSRSVWNPWASFSGDWFNRANIGQYSGYDLRSAGVAVGADRKVTKNAFVGAAFGYDNAYQNFRTIDSSNQMDVFRAVLYGGLRNKNAYADGYIGYTNDRHKTRRDIDIDGGAFRATARSKFNDDMFSTGFEIGRKMPLLTPSIGLHYVRLSSPNVRETGGGASNLYVNSGSYDSLQLPIGVKLSRDFGSRDGIVWTPEFRAFYVREFADDAVHVRTSLAGVGFLADSGKWGRNSGRLGVGLGVRLADSVGFRIDYDYEIYDYTNVDGLSTTLNVKW